MKLKKNLKGFWIRRYLCEDVVADIHNSVVEFLNLGEEC